MFRTAVAFIATVVILMAILQSCHYDPSVIAEGHIRARYMLVQYPDTLPIVILLTAQGDTIDVRTDWSTWQTNLDRYYVANSDDDSIVARRVCITPPNWDRYSYWRPYQPPEPAGRAHRVQAAVKEEPP